MWAGKGSASCCRYDLHAAFLPFLKEEEPRILREDILAVLHSAWSLGFAWGVVWRVTYLESHWPCSPQWLQLFTDCLCDAFEVQDITVEIFGTGLQGHAGLDIISSASIPSPQ